MRIFETDRLIVRHYTADDRDNFFSINGDEEVMRYIRAPKSKEECDQFLEEIITGYEENPEMGRWAVDDKRTGTFIGSFAFIPVEGTGDKQLGYALLKENWGTGFATELMHQGIKYVFEKTDLNEVYGITEAANVASQKVLTKTGFVLHKTYKEGEKDMFCFILRRANS